MRSSTGRMLRLVACLFVLSYAHEATGQAERWVFSSLWGQKIAVSRSSARDEYALSVADVIHRVPACDTRGYRICFVTTSLSVAIPSEPPADGDAWREHGATFWLEAVISDVRVDVLGASAEPLYVIRVDHNLHEKLGTHTVRRHRLYYSYQLGLLAFEELMEGESSPLFLASRLPTLGSDASGEE